MHVLEYGREYTKAESSSDEYKGEQKLERSGFVGFGDTSEKQRRRPLYIPPGSSDN